MFGAQYKKDCLEIYGTSGGVGTYSQAENSSVMVVYAAMCTKATNTKVARDGG